jgi:hypothetical protein
MEEKERTGNRRERGIPGTPPWCVLLRRLLRPTLVAVWLHPGGEAARRSPPSTSEMRFSSAFCGWESALSHFYSAFCGSGCGLSGLTRGCSWGERSAGDWGRRRDGDWRGEEGWGLGSGWVCPDLGFHRPAAGDESRRERTPVAPSDHWILHIVGPRCHRLAGR